MRCMYSRMRFGCNQEKIFNTTWRTEKKRSERSERVLATAQWRNGCKQEETRETEGIKAGSPHVRKPGCTSTQSKVIQEPDPEISTVCAELSTRTTRLRLPGERTCRAKSRNLDRYCNHRLQRIQS